MANRKTDRNNRQHHGLGGSHVVGATGSGGHNLHGEGLDVVELRRRKGRHRHHERQERSGDERRREHRQQHRAPHPEPAGAQIECGLFHGGVRSGEGRGDGEVEVGVHRHGVDQKDTPDTVRGDGRGVGTKVLGQEPRNDPALGVEEVERDGADQGRQRHRQEGKEPQDLPAREIEPGQQDSERGAEDAGGQDRGERYPDGQSQSRGGAAVEESLVGIAVTLNACGGRRQHRHNDVDKKYQHQRGRQEVDEPVRGRQCGTLPDPGCGKAHGSTIHTRS